MTHREWQHRNSGQAVILLTLFFLFISGAIVSGMIFAAITRTRIAREFPRAKQSYFLAESGAEDVAYRVMRARNYDSSETIQLNGSSAAITAVENLATGAIEVSAEADIGSNIRLAEIHLVPGTSALFSYGVQVGNGGLLMEQTSTVNGNIYSNGPIIGANKNGANGDVVSAGATGLIDDINVVGDAYAHEIKESDIDGDAYYQVIDGATTVAGAQYPGSPDQPDEQFPISDAKLDEWEQLAASTEISSPCPYKIDSARSIGPAKITCDVEITGNFTLTLTGALWITGNLTTKNNPIIRLDPSLGKKSVAIIVHDPANELMSSKIDFQNSLTFENSGTAGSYIFVASRNRSAEAGGGETAIASQQAVSGALLLYAPHGEITLYQSSSLKEATGYKIHLRNSATVTYETGLASMLFDFDPFGSFEVQRWWETE